MKYYIFSLFFIIVFGSCTHESREPSFVISGKISGIDDGFIILHSRIADITDKTAIRNGEFRFHGKVEEPIQCIIEVQGKPGEKTFYLENSDISFTADINQIEKAKIEGSQMQSDKEEYDSVLHLIDLRFNIKKTDNEYDTASEDRKLEILRIFRQYDHEQTLAKRKFIEDHPSSYLSAVILWDIDWTFRSASEFDDLVNKLSPGLSEYSYLKRIKTIFNRLRKVEINRIAPDFTMKDSENRPVTMSDISGKAKYLLIDFWASGCGPCRRNNKKLVKIYEKYHNMGFDILGVSTDTDKNRWKEAILTDGLTWTNVCNFDKWNNNEIVEMYALRQQSENIMVDNTRKIIARNIHGKELEKKLDSLLVQKQYWKK